MTNISKLVEMGLVGDRITNLQHVEESGVHLLGKSLKYFSTTKKTKYCPTIDTRGDLLFIVEVITNENNNGGL